MRIRSEEDGVLKRCDQKKKDTTKKKTVETIDY